MLKADGFDQAIIGRARRCGQEDIIAYDYEQCIAILILQGMTDEEAVEYMEFNVVGAYVGEGTPIFIYTGEDIEADH